MTTRDNGKPVVAPLFESVMERIEALFRSRTLTAGSKLPPEKRLAASLGVSRHTLPEVLKALNLSASSVRGRGTAHTYSGRYPASSR